MNLYIEGVYRQQKKQMNKIYIKMKVRKFNLKKLLRKISIMYITFVMLVVNLFLASKRYQRRYGNKQKLGE